MEKEFLIREDEEGQLFFDFFEDGDLVDSKHWMGYGDTL